MPQQKQKPQTSFVIVNWSYLVLLFHRETVRESGPHRKLIFIYGSLDETFFYLFQSGRRATNVSVSVSRDLHRL